MLISSTRNSKVERSVALGRSPRSRPALKGRNNNGYHALSGIVEQLTSNQGLRFAHSGYYPPPFQGFKELLKHALEKDLNPVGFTDVLWLCHRHNSLESEKVRLMRCSMKRLSAASGSNSN
jgi:hypothetical protein